MGFSTTQKAKTAIIAAIEEAGSSMEVAGKMTAAGDVTNQVLKTVNIPLKIVSGGATSNLGGNATSVRYISGDVEYDNIYFCGPIAGEYITPTLAWDAALAAAAANGCAAQVTSNPITGVPLAQTTAIIYWSVNLNDNSILDIAEHAIMSV